MEPYRDLSARPQSLAAAGGRVLWSWLCPLSFTPVHVPLPPRCGPPTSLFCGLKTTGLEPGPLHQVRVQRPTPGLCQAQPSSTPADRAVALNSSCNPATHLPPKGCYLESAANEIIYNGPGRAPGIQWPNPGLGLPKMGPRATFSCTLGRVKQQEEGPCQHPQHSACGFLSPWGPHCL